MLYISPEFRKALVSSHVVIVKAEVLSNGVVQAELDVSDGTVDVDGGNLIRRSATAQLVDSTGTLTPADANALIAPRGNEIRLLRGIRYRNSVGVVVDEFVPLGVFGISKVDIGDYGEGVQLKVTMYDRARRVQRNRFPTVYTVANDTNGGIAIQNIISSRVPSTEFNFPSVSDTTPKLTFGIDDETKDPWVACQQIATSMNHELYYAPDGRCTLRPIPVYTEESSVWDYLEGPEAIILGLEKSFDDERIYNHVIVTGENSRGAPVRAEAKDTNPQSPTYYLGDFGDVVYFFTSKFITTVVQAQALATSLLQKVISGIEAVRFPAIVNPAHEIGDVVRIVRETSKVNAYYILASLAIPLSASSPLQATTYERRASF